MLLIIDSNMIGYLAKYAMKGFSLGEGMNVAVIFFFLKKVLSIAKEFRSNRLIFTWDSRKSLRRERYSSFYKMERRVRRDHESEEEKELHALTMKQFVELRKVVLPELGFGNVFMKVGYEGDDIIASVAIRSKEETVIVGRDRDLYQLISGNVSYYDPVANRLTTRSGFVKEWGIEPSIWGQVLTLAGCHGDNVKGVEGIGIKTAIKYLNGELKADSEAVRMINFYRMFGWLEDNAKLVVLPFEETPKFEIKKDQFRTRKFMEVFGKYQLNSFIKGFGGWSEFINGYD